MSTHKKDKTDKGDIKKYKDLYKNRSDPTILKELISFVKENEPLLKEPETKKYTLLPLQYPDMYKAYEEHSAVFWTAKEIKYAEDIDSWKTLNSDERDFIEKVLAFFAGSDGIVMKNISVNFVEEIIPQEAKIFYAFQNAIEAVHSDTYSRLIDTYVDEKKKNNIFNAIEKMPCVAKKAEWALQWLDASKNIFSERLVAFSAVEGIFFSGSFASIYWLKDRGLMTKALAVSNEFIARDETLHTNFAILVYNHLRFKLSEERIKEIFRSAVDVEIEFITESLPCRLIGMKSTDMIEYIQSVCDYRLSQYGISPMYGSKNPFPFMEKLALNIKSNFFEKTVTDYSMAASKNTEKFDKTTLTNLANEDF
jgi:ribonucleotide reductase beta subunit family protein with ferritin-like domain